MSHVVSTKLVSSTVTNEVSGDATGIASLAEARFGSDPRRRVCVTFFGLARDRGLRFRVLRCRVGIEVAAMAVAATRIAGRTPVCRRVRGGVIVCARMCVVLGERRREGCTIIESRVLIEAATGTALSLAGVDVIRKVCGYLHKPQASNGLAAAVTAPSSWPSR